MVLQDCERCGRTFAAEDGQVLCKKCLEEEVEVDFRKVRDYLYDNPGADINEVERETGVEKKIILKLLKDDRIEIVDVDNSILSCEKCGKQIKSGRLCEDCKKIKLAKEFRDVASDIKKDLTPKDKEYKFKKKVTFHTR